MNFFKKRALEAMVSSPEYAQAYAEAKKEAIAGADEMEGFDNGVVIVTSTSTIMVNGVVVQASSEPFGSVPSSGLLTSALPTVQPTAVTSYAAA